MFSTGHNNGSQCFINNNLSLTSRIVRMGYHSLFIIIILLSSTITTAITTILLPLLGR
jgi:hypothetical protein